MLGQLRSLGKQLEDLLADHRQTALLMVLIALASTQLFFTLTDANTAARAELRSLMQQRVRAEALAEAARDQDVSAAAAAASEAVREQSYRAPTFALARLKAEQDIGGMARTAGLTNRLQLRADPELTGEGSMRLVSLTIEHRLDWPAVIAFLDLLAQSDKAITVEGFRRAPGAARLMQIELTVPLAEGPAA